MDGQVNGNGNGKGVTIPGDVDGHVEAFLRDCELRGMTPGSVRAYRSCMRCWSRFLKANNVTADTGRENLERFLHHLRAEQGYSHATLENYFATLSSFYKYLIYKDLVPNNPALAVRERYLRTYKKNGNGGSGGVARRVPTSEELTKLLASIISPRDRALVLLLAKTGVRRAELEAMDTDDIDWGEGSVTLKPAFAKRSNRVVFFDGECERALRRWLHVRSQLGTGSTALFVGVDGTRLRRHGVYDVVLKYAERNGLHDPKSEMREDHFGPHSLRYWFTHTLLQEGMRREMVQELRGDARKEAVDLYDRIPRDELRDAYLTFMPDLGV